MPIYTKTQKKKSQLFTKEKDLLKYASICGQNYNTVQLTHFLSGQCITNKVEISIVSGLLPRHTRPKTVE